MPKKNQAANKPAVPPTASAAESGKPRPIQFPTPLMIEYSERGRTGQPADAKHEVLPPLDVDAVKTLLGWEAEADGVSFGEHYALVDEEGKKVRLTNNQRNRPLDPERYRQYAQEHLNRRWKLNGDPITFGQTGIVVSFQHRGVGFVLADQMRRGKDAPHWERLWPADKPLTYETFAIFGVDESIEVLNTVDNGKPRDVKDALFAQGLFADNPELTQRQQAELCSMTQWTVKMLWMRTGQRRDAFSGRMTNAEVIDWLGRHPHVVLAVKHIWEESDKVAKFISPPYAAALLYLMGCSATADGDAYRALDSRNESVLDWGLWDKAMDFWALIPEDPAFKALRALKTPTEGAREGDEFLTPLFATKGGSRTERMAAIIKAWGLYASGDKISDSDLLPRDAWHIEYVGEDVPGEKDMVSKVVGYRLNDSPLVAGIDTDGNGKDHDDEAADDSDDKPEGDPTPEEIEAQAESLRAEKEAAKDAAEKSRKEKAARLQALKQSKRAEASTAAAPPKSLSLAETVAELREAHPNKVLLFRYASGEHRAFGEDADVLGKTLKLGIKVQSGMKTANIPNAKMEAGLRKLLESSYRVAICEMVGKEINVTDAEFPEAKAAPKPAKAAK